MGSEWRETVHLLSEIADHAIVIRQLGRSIQGEAELMAARLERQQREWSKPQVEKAFREVVRIRRAMEALSWQLRDASWNEGEGDD